MPLRLIIRRAKLVVSSVTLPCATAQALGCMELYEAEFGEPLSQEEARGMISRLLILYELLSQRVPEKVGGRKAPLRASLALKSVRFV